MSQTFRSTHAPQISRSFCHIRPYDSSGAVARQERNQLDSSFSSIVTNLILQPSNAQCAGRQVHSRFCLLSCPTRGGHEKRGEL